MTNQQWFYNQNGNQSGPISMSELQQLLASAQILPSTLVWTAGMANWQPAAQVLPNTVPGIPPVPGAPPIAYASPMPPQPIGHDPAMRWMLPVGRSGWAIAAGYLGLLFIIPFFGPAAIFCAIMAVIEMKKNPNKHGMGRAITGFVGGLLGLILTIGILWAWASR